MKITTEAAEDTGRLQPKELRVFRAAVVSVFVSVKSKDGHPASGN
jgi:hypothetical protein